MQCNHKVGPCSNTQSWYLCHSVFTGPILLGYGLSKMQAAAHAKTLLRMNQRQATVEGTPTALLRSADLSRDYSAL